MEPGRMDLVDHLDRDATSADMGGEGLLEAGVDPDPPEPIGLGSGEIEHHDPAGVTCVGLSVKAFLAEGAGPMVLVKVERPQRSEDVRP